MIRNPSPGSLLVALATSHPLPQGERGSARVAEFLQTIVVSSNSMRSSDRSVQRLLHEPREPLDRGAPRIRKRVEHGEMIARRFLAARRNSGRGPALGDLPALAQRLAPFLRAAH